MLKFLADETIGIKVVKALRESYDVESVIESMRGAKNGDVLRKAFDEKRILITNDKDFGELIYYRKESHHGVILLRLRNDTFTNRISTLRKVIDCFGEDLKNKFTVATETKVRMRKI